MARRYSERQFRAAVEDPRVRTMADLCRALGLVPRGGNYESLRRYGETIGIDLAPRVRAPARLEVEPEHLEAAVAQSSSMAATLRALGHEPTSARYRLLQQHIEELGLSTDHWLGQGWARGTSRPSRRKPLTDYLQRDRPTRTSRLRQRLIEEGLKRHQCEHCGGDRWLEGPVPLELDHINGDRGDNRLANLRLLCPNCHAQTPTYRGRNIGRTRRREPRRARDLD